MFVTFTLKVNKSTWNTFYHTKRITQITKYVFKFVRTIYFIKITKFFEANWVILNFHHFVLINCCIHNRNHKIGAWKIVSKIKLENIQIIKNINLLIRWIINFVFKTYLKQFARLYLWVLDRASNVIRNLSFINKKCNNKKTILHFSRLCSF